MFSTPGDHAAFLLPVLSLVRALRARAAFGEACRQPFISLPSWPVWFSTTAMPLDRMLTRLLYYARRLPVYYSIRAIPAARFA
jgi:hypothetical protein